MDVRHSLDRIQGIAQHVLAYYLWGLFELQEEGNLISLIYTRAPDEARAELVALAGRLLRGDEGAEISDSQVRRLADAWTYGRELIEREPGNSPLTMAAFAWWSGAPRLDISWWLEQLRWVLRHSVAPDPSFLVLEALPGAAAVDPLATVDALRKMLDVVREPWSFAGHIDDVHRALSVVMSSGSEIAVERGRRIIDELGAREIADLSDLLR